ncbi:MAG: tail fiber protein, partial [Cyclobacteriaceae bacterium]
TQGHMQIAGDFTATGKLRTNSGSINSGSDALLLMYGERSDDNNYEWTGFYSGTTRQGIILYDGAWGGANNLTNEFSITAESGNKLTLNAQGTDIALMPGGNVGIGTTSPNARLQINGVGASNIDLRVNGRIVTGDSGNSGGMWVNGAQTMFMGQSGSSLMGFYNGGAWRLVADNNGNVGIGTESPDSKLTVKGIIHTQEVKVDLNGSVAPDYVFEKDYPLTSLEELESYIDQNKHLPEVPSAKEMEEEGINLKEMNLLLLKKVEELTLHLIEMKSENKKSNEKIALLEYQIENIRIK